MRVVNEESYLLNYIFLKIFDILGYITFLGLISLGTFVGLLCFSYMFLIPYWIITGFFK